MKSAPENVEHAPAGKYTLPPRVDHLPDKTGWQVDVYGAGMTRPAGKLIYSLSGVLLPDPSTPPEQMRRALVEISTQP